MMFMMPMPPTSSETPAMLASSDVIVWVVSVRTLAISSIVRTMKSSGSPGWILWRTRRSDAIAIGDGGDLVAEIAPTPDLLDERDAAELLHARSCTGAKTTSS